MSSNVVGPSLLAERIMRSPAPIMRSKTPCLNRMSLICSSGISIDWRAIHPSRWITRSEVTTKYEVSQAVSRRIG